MKSTDVVQDPPVDPYWLDVPAAARYLCMTPHAIYHRINRRDIPFVRQGRMVRFDRHELDRWMRKSTRPRPRSGPRRYCREQVEAAQLQGGDL